jgi:outer membrane protein assembly factor BamE (lipoprotein component of BamABCDE complex)
MKIAPLLLILALTFGCAVHGVKHESGNPINEDNVKKIVDGRTTTTDIIALFGAPTLTSTAGPEEIYVYKHCKSGGTGFSIAGLGSTSTKEICNVLTVSFDKEKGTVKSHNYQKNWD